jgi:hypothetical protein
MLSSSERRRMATRVWSQVRAVHTLRRNMKTDGAAGRCRRSGSSGTTTDDDDDGQGQTLADLWNMMRFKINAVEKTRAYSYIDAANNRLPTYSVSVKCRVGNPVSSS